MTAISSPDPVKPFLRWAGSKKKLIPTLSRYWSPSFKRYVEPFAGSCCLFFALKPAAAVLSDKNAELIETYEVVRRNPSGIHRSLSALPRNKSTYYYQRSLDPKKLTKFRRAVRFLYLNRNCFNGIYRTNMHGEFNVPFAASRVGPYASMRELSICASMLKNVRLRACDFGTTLRSTGKGDFVYLDPPYAVSTRRIFREYGERMFGFDDLPRLANHLCSMDKRGAKFLVSYADSPEARELSNGWYVEHVRTRRNIAGFKGARRIANELLISNIQSVE